MFSFVLNEFDLISITSLFPWDSSILLSQLYSLLLLFFPQLLEFLQSQKYDLFFYLFSLVVNCIEFCPDRFSGTICFCLIALEFVANETWSVSLLNLLWIRLTFAKVIVFSLYLISLRLIVFLFGQILLDLGVLPPILIIV